MTQQQHSKLPVILYVPNILCYIRIILAFIGLYISLQQQPVQAVIVWIFSAFLDLFDGMLARYLNQCSTLGILLDIAADNILRTIVWIAVIIEAAKNTNTTQEQEQEQYQQCSIIILISTIIICLEWITMVCTQLHSTQFDGGIHWKKQREEDPYWIKAVFTNNFKSPLGCLAIYGLFSANLFAYGSYYNNIFIDSIPMFTVFQYIAYIGRGLTILIELWLCKGYLSLVISKDIETNNQKNTTTTKKEN